MKSPHKFEKTQVPPRRMTKRDKNFIAQVTVKLQARVVREVDNAIHRINHYPTDSVFFF